LLLTALEKARHQAYIAKCAANLHTIGQALAIYVNENHGNYPRTRWVAGAPLTAGTNPASADTFGPTGPAPNDTSAGPFLLLRTQKIGSAAFICPYNDETTFTADPAVVTDRSNFTDYRANLAYSFANPYPDAAADKSGYRWAVRLSADFAVAADLNPGVSPPGVALGMSRALQMQSNSRNHEGDGQNVLYGDGHVDWRQSVFVGVANDDIYTNRAGQLNASPVDKDDSVLVPMR
jgi:prepilin-type processing-associated H-X9-DG protein